MTRYFPFAYCTFRLKFMKILSSHVLTVWRHPMIHCVCWMVTKTASTAPARRLSAWCEFSLCSKSTSMSVTVTTMRREPYCPCPGKSSNGKMSVYYNKLLRHPHVCLCPKNVTSIFNFFCRAFRGKHITLIVRFPNQGRQVDDLDIWSHTNDTIGSVRRGILNRIKANAAHTKIELFIGGEVVDPADDRKLIGQLNLKDKTVRMCSSSSVCLCPRYIIVFHPSDEYLLTLWSFFVQLITAKLTQVSANMPSSPDSSSDSSTGSPGNHGNHYSDGPNPEVESCLPGVVSLQHRY